MPLSFQVTDIKGENITVECFMPLPLAENQEERFYLEDPITIHISRAQCYARPMMEVHNYDGTNPRRMRAFRECKDDERVETYGDLYS